MVLMCVGTPELFVIPTFFVKTFRGLFLTLILLLRVCVPANCGFFAHTA